MEESVAITDRVRSFLSRIVTKDHPLPWDVPDIMDDGRDTRATKIKEIERRLGIFPDGNYVPPTFRQILLRRSDPLSKLTRKIKKVRHDSREIVRVINSFNPWEHDVKDTRLIRHFILECLSPFKRKTLEFTNATYDECPTSQSSWFTYIASWILIYGILTFFLYWIFAWGIYQGEDILLEWGKTYGATAVNDILFVQVVKVYITYYLPAQAMQPQLKRIRKVLADISMKYINHDGGRHHITRPTELGRDKNDLRDEICVAQHMSAACRAAWSRELKDLPSAWLLRQVRMRSATLF